MFLGVAAEKASVIAIGSSVEPDGVRRGAGRATARARGSATTGSRSSRGRYYSEELDMPVTIAAREGVLVVMRPRADELRFVPLAEDLFTNSDQMLLRVVRDATGSRHRIRAHRESRARSGVHAYERRLERELDASVRSCVPRHTPVPLCATVGGASRARRRRGERILRPVVLRVAAAHVLPHVEVARAPEAGEIARDLHRTCAGESRCIVTGTRPPAMRGDSVSPNTSCKRTASTGACGSE